MNTDKNKLENEDMIVEMFEKLRAEFRSELVRVHNEIRAEIGDLKKAVDGKWGVFLKFLQLSFCVVMVPWCVWTTKQIIDFQNFMAPGPRLTIKDIENAQLRVKGEVTAEMGTKIDNLANKVERLELTMERHIAADSKKNQP